MIGAAPSARGVSASWRSILAALVLVAGCGGGGVANPGGTQAFDVMATLTLTPQGMGGGYWPDFPRAQKVTLVWNADARLVFVGGEGRVEAAEVASDDGRTQRTTGTVSLPMPFNPTCNRKGGVTYDQIVFSLENGALHGTARGTAQYQTGDEIFSADMTATLAGVADVTPPRFAALAGEIDPLAVPGILPSEPLPPTATASLVGAPSGDVIALEPGRVQGAGSGAVTTGFWAPQRALRSGETYTMKLDGVVDFAGNAAIQALAFTTRAAPPLVSEDGFEAVATATLGGAGVLRGEPLTPITGTTSLILNTGVGGGFGFLPYMLGPSLAVRLAVAPGDTVVRFQRRIVATYDLPSVRFYGSVRLGAVGGAIATGPSLEAHDLVKVTLPRDGDVFVSGVETIEIPLPAGITGEIIFEIDGQTSGCGLPPPPTALVIDDLRVE